MDEDISLMQRLKSGDRGAFNTLVDRHSKHIINYLFRMTGSREDSIDLAQDVFVKVYNAAPGYIPSAKFTTWLYRIASNAAVDFLRRRKGPGGAESLDADGAAALLQDKKPGADAALAAEERDENIRQALLSLPERQRAAIVLKVYEERPYAEIASIIGVSVASVESLLFRARQGLKGRLKDKDR